MDDGSNFRRQNETTNSEASQKKRDTMGSGGVIICNQSPSTDGLIHVRDLCMNPAPVPTV